MRFERLTDFDGARDAACPSEREREVVRRAQALRARLLAGPRVLAYRTFPLVRVPYPTKYAFWDATTALTPLLHIVNKLFVVQLQTREGVRTLLISPSDRERNKRTPFFADLAGRARLFGAFGERLLAPELGTVAGSLARCGLTPDDVDWIAYDHLHTQDLRGWLGAPGVAPFFPRAKLLVQRAEWDSMRGLLPLQQRWYCPGGADGIDPARVVLLDDDVRLGDGVAIVRTPGHTVGNASFVVNTDEGLLVTSENGVGPDSWAPRASAIPGVARFARRTGADVILNGNTQEGSVDQYLSMVQEKTLAGPSPRNPAFTNCVASSELAAYWAFPGIRPTWSTGELSFGTFRRRAAAPVAVAASA